MPEKPSYTELQDRIAMLELACARAGEKLRQSEERFQQVFLTSPDAMNINRYHDGAYLEINEGFTELTGYAREDVIAKRGVLYEGVLFIRKPFTAQGLAAKVREALKQD